MERFKDKLSHINTTCLSGDKWWINMRLKLLRQELESMSPNTQVLIQTNGCYMRWGLLLPLVNKWINSFILSTCL